MKKIFYILFLLPLLLSAQAWDDVGGGINGSQILGMNVANNSLYIAGSFSAVGGVNANACARWDGLAWDSLSSGSTIGTARSFAFYNGYLYAGGDFNNMGGVANTYHFARWNGTQWQSVISGTTNGTITCMTIYNGKLFAVGNFTLIGGKAASRIASWNGSQWQALDSGLGGFGNITSLAVYNNELYVAGDFSSAGSIPVYNIARWNGTQWDSVAGGLNSMPTAMTVDTIQNKLYVGGLFTAAANNGNYVPVQNIASWDGTQWAAMGNTGMGNDIQCMTMYKDQLYVSGSAFADSVFVRYKGGGIWEKLAKLNGIVNNMVVYKNELYLAGSFNLINDDTTYKSIARYNDLTGFDREKKSSNGSLGDPKPNPFNSRTLIPYLIEQECTSAKLMITDITGKTVQEYPLNKDRIAIEINMDDYNNGTYLYSLVIDGVVINTRRMALSK